MTKQTEQREALDIHFKQLLLSRPIAGPPGIPADRLKALRDAFAAALKDREFLAEAERVGLEIDFASFDEVEDLLKQYASFSANALREGCRAAAERHQRMDRRAPLTPPAAMAIVP